MEISMEFACGFVIGWLCGVINAYLAYKNMKDSHQI